MISTVTNEKLYEYRGLSTDTKPIDGVGNGSVYFCIDTSDVYMFDEENKLWRKL